MDDDDFHDDIMGLLRSLLDNLRTVKAAPYVRKLWTVYNPFNPKKPFGHHWFNPLDCFWMLTLGGRMPGAFESTIDDGRSIWRWRTGTIRISKSKRNIYRPEGSRIFCAKVAMVLMQYGVVDPAHESNGCVLRTLCCLGEEGVLRNLVGAGIGGKWVTKGLFKGLFGFMVSKLDEDILQLLLKCAPKDLFEAKIIGPKKMDVMGALVEHYKEWKGLDFQVPKLISMVTMLLRAGVSRHTGEMALRPRHGLYMPTSDPMEQLIVHRYAAIVQDQLDRDKISAFAAGRWGRFLGRDIVESHILPFVVTLGGRAQKELDMLLDREKIPGDRRECFFYYQCLLKGLVRDPLVAWEFRFIEQLHRTQLREVLQIQWGLQESLSLSFEDDLLRMPEGYDAYFEAFTIARQRFAHRNDLPVTGAWWPFYGEVLW